MWGRVGIWSFQSHLFLRCVRCVLLPGLDLSPVLVPFWLFFGGLGSLLGGFALGAFGLVTDCFLSLWNSPQFFTSNEVLFSISLSEFLLIVPMSVSFTFIMRFSFRISIHSIPSPYKV